MKRPIALYFVAAWCLLAITPQLFFPNNNLVFFLPRLFRPWVPLAALAANVWLVVGLFQLKRIHRGICIGLLGFVAARMGLFLLLVLTFPVPGRGRPPLSSGDWAALAAFLIAVLLDIVCICYLSRRSFRDFAELFEQEAKRQKWETAGTDAPISANPPRLLTMRRPVALYFVAAWLCLTFLHELLTCCAFQYSLNRWHIPIPVLGFLIIAGLAFDVWLTVGLIKLKSICRWICVAFFYCSTAAIGSLLVMEALCLEIPKHFKQNPSAFVANLGFFALFFIPIFLNILSIWYLSRRSFREFARQFVEERRRRG